MGTIIRCFSSFVFRKHCISLQCRSWSSVKDRTCPARAIYNFRSLAKKIQGIGGRHPDISSDFDSLWYDGFWDSKHFHCVHVGNRHALETLLDSALPIQTRLCRSSLKGLKVDPGALAFYSNIDATALERDITYLRSLVAEHGLFYAGVCFFTSEPTQGSSRT